MSEKKIESFKFGLKDLDSFPGKNKIDEIFERIVKDIKEREDEVMAKEFTQIIGKLLRENGVVPHIVKIENMECAPYSVEKHYGVTIDELDFSEHDKVFEDKIAELKKDYKTASELLGKYQQENESLKKRVVELENFSCQAEQETESLVEKLNQRIVKLEKSRSEWIDKTVEWQQKCEKLESKETEIVSGIDTSNSLACAKSLIEHMTHCEKFMIMPERDVQTFSVEELKEIADYLMVYYKHHKDRDAEDTISF